jgi:CRP-like cAMP-binding protein
VRLNNIFADTSKARSFAAGTKIFQKGDNGDEMFVVKEGEVDIVIDDFPPRNGSC